MRLEKRREKLPPNLPGKLTEIVASGRSGRGPSVLCTPDLWDAALSLILKSRRIAVISGFYVPSVSAPETHGPVGALVLSRALAALGFETEVWTDGLCLDSFLACADAAAYPTEKVVCPLKYESSLKPDLLVYIERLGRAADGAYYNMRGENITDWTAPLDQFALVADTSILGIGDGGNEVGMGNYTEELREIMPDYADCLCVVKADVCIPVDVSNWGAYALTAGLSVLYGEWLGQTAAEETAMLEALCSCGGVDGCTKVCATTVDGLSLADQLHIVRTLRDILPGAPAAGS